MLEYCFAGGDKTCSLKSDGGSQLNLKESEYSHRKKQLIGHNTPDVAHIYRCDSDETTTIRDFLSKQSSNNLQR